MSMLNYCMESSYSADKPKSESKAREMFVKIPPLDKLPSPPSFGEPSSAIPELTKTAYQTDDSNKNNPKLLRWEIYNLIDRYAGDICKTVRTTIKMEVEDLFKKYANS